MTSHVHTDRENFNLESALTDAQDRFTAHHPNSAAHFKKACDVLPGGNTRSVLHFDPFPLVMTGGTGATVRDADGHEYIDFIGEYTAGLFGHSNPQIIASVTNAMKDGILLCAPSEKEQQFASLICSRYPSAELLRFCNSGTEANLMSITAARAHTGKTHIMVFKGGYHGGVLLFANGNNANNAPYPFVVGEYNDIENLETLIATHANEMAAVLIEPMMGTGGAIAADLQFLQRLRELCSLHNIVLIFDEVMTSRLSRGGLQHLHSIVPDMTSFGKYLGGGMGFGAFAGKETIMKQFDPRQPDYLAHAGTFNNNLLTMSAGITTLEELYTAEIADNFLERGNAFKLSLQNIAEEMAVPVQISGIGSLLCVHFSHQEINKPQAAQAVNPQLRQLFQLYMLEHGIYLSKLGYMALMLALTDEDLSKFRTIFRQFIVTHKALITQHSAA